jgi:hypothetical protein
VLNREQAAAIEALGDTLLPGASAAALAHFLDAQLAKPPEQSLLTLRYMDVAPTAWGLVREPDAGNPHVRFDERGVETELRLSH